MFVIFNDPYKAALFQCLRCDLVERAECGIDLLP
jgi:hypothetical protein